MSLTVTLYGKPAPQGSKRAVMIGGKARVIDASPHTRPWRHALTAEMAAVAPPAPLEGAWALLLTILVARPRAHYGTGRNAGVLKETAPQFPASGADVDKCLRAAFDAAQAAGWVRNDAQISDALVRRRYSPDGRESVSVALMCVEPLEVGLP